MLSKAGFVIYKNYLKTTGNSSDLLNPPHRSLEEELNIHTKALGRFPKVYISLNNSGEWKLSKFDIYLVVYSSKIGLEIFEEKEPMSAIITIICYNLSLLDIRGWKRNFCCYISSISKSIMGWSSQQEHVQLTAYLFCLHFGLNRSPNLWRLILTIETILI